jgi:putative PIN family toxin of toxin-antitoxin system
VKVVFDTNVYVSALTLPKGSAAQALDRVVIGEHELFLSKPILDELLGVLARKFARDREELARVALFLSELATILRPRRRLSVLDDEADNRILECGLAGRVDAIVTGDKRMLKLVSHAEIRIITIRWSVAGQE